MTIDIAINSLYFIIDWKAWKRKRLPEGNVAREETFNVELWF